LPLLSRVPRPGPACLRCLAGCAQNRPSLTPPIPVLGPSSAGPDKSACCRQPGPARKFAQTTTRVTSSSDSTQDLNTICERFDSTDTNLRESVTNLTLPTTYRHRGWRPPSSTDGRSLLTGPRHDTGETHEPRADSIHLRRRGQYRGPCCTGP